MVHSRKVVFVAVLLACSAAHAVHVTALPGSTSITLPVVNEYNVGPKVMAPGITWSAESGSSVYGWGIGYGFASNGFWRGLSMIATNTGSTAMRIDFATPVSGFGGFMNWGRKDDGSPDGSPAVISAYDSSNTLLESYTLTFGPLGGTDSGEFHGFLRAAGDISAITFAGAYIGAANLQVLNAAPVPEPSTYALMALGLLAVGAVARRKA